MLKGYLEVQGPNGISILKQIFGMYNLVVPMDSVTAQSFYCIIHMYLLHNHNDYTTQNRMLHSL